MSRRSRPQVFCEKGVLRNFPKIHRKTPEPESLFKLTCKLGTCNFIKKENLAQVFSSEFCEISKNTFSYRTPLVATSNCHLYCNSKYYHSSSEAYLDRCHISNDRTFLRKWLTVSFSCTVNKDLHGDSCFLQIVLTNFANFSGKRLCCRPSGLQLYYKKTPTIVLFC